MAMHRYRKQDQVKLPNAAYSIPLVSKCLLDFLMTILVTQLKLHTGPTRYCYSANSTPLYTITVSQIFQKI